MFIPLVCFVCGLVAMGKTKPVTTVRKILCLGPRTGIVWQVEDFREIGTVVVRDPQKQAVAQFIRVAVNNPGKPGLIWQNGSGNPTLLQAMKTDFGVEASKLAAVGGRQSAVGPEKKEEKTS